MVLGNSETIPITKGQLAIGTWQVSVRVRTRVRVREGQRLRGAAKCAGGGIAESVQEAELCKKAECT